MSDALKLWTVNGPSEPDSADVGVGLLAVAVAWDFYGLYAGFFEQAWGAAPVPVPLLSYALNGAIVIWLPFAGRNLRTTEGVAWALGLWSLGGVVGSPLLGSPWHSLAPAVTVALCGFTARAMRRARREPVPTR